MAGVEPASEIKIQRTSTYIVCFILNFKLPNRQRSLKVCLLQISLHLHRQQIRLSYLNGVHSNPGKRENEERLRIIYAAKA